MSDRCLVFSTNSGGKSPFHGGDQGEGNGAFDIPVVWGFLWGLLIHLNTFRHIPIQVATTSKVTDSKGVAGISVVLSTS